MYYCEPHEYVGDIVTFYVDNKTLFRRLKAGLKIRYNGQDVPVKLNAFKSGFIL